MFEVKYSFMKIMVQDFVYYKVNKFKSTSYIGIIHQQNINSVILNMNHYLNQELDEVANKALKMNIGISAETLKIIINLNVSSCVKLKMILLLLIIIKVNMVFSIQIILYSQFCLNLNLLLI